MRPTLVWFRRDLRLADNPALAAAAEGGPVLPVYIHAPHEEAPWQPGAASRWWLHHSLHALAARLRARGLPLIVIQAEATLAALRGLVADTGARRIVWNRLYEPAVITRDRTIKQALRADGVAAESYNAALLFEPWEIRKRDGGHYRAFTPFHRALEGAGDPPAPLDIPHLEPAHTIPRSATVDDLGLLPAVPWDRGLRARWTPGEEGARRRLEQFVGERLEAYAENRDVPAQSGTSGLSAPLHFGEVGPRQIHAAVRGRIHDDGAGAFLGEIAWREFAHHLLFHCPSMPDEPLDTRFRAFPWRADQADLLRAWQAGRTGIPIVDAGMRELWTTGWMHNRLRMVVGSLLTKNLRIPWQEGERWFWDTLVDADLASNSMGWQWIQGCGADAAPYFRIFNPVRQGERFDPDGAYVRHWVPELAALPAKHIHAPWRTPAAELREAGVQPGRTYPEPVVDLAATRKEALKAYQAIR
ncbi:deoxyribodipyrimidine photo-lyase [Aquisalimonas lutea]|uniref:cryptochrome/photolyase family protein n=1 Tax=Aquisalimonas lutea TaxID=1327750 RepID=UPI0025B518A1|nr:deoxyribodipyrimidine photo-lyase [Aquisalimonas lutea]MDN3516085.1 deoxyribodipyrimidine photo-lyase [Aquisalimonas lutea]